MLRLVRTVVLALGILTALVGCDSQDNRLQRWHALFVDPPILLSNMVIAIHQSPEGTLWFGTGSGVSRFEPATGQWQTFTTKEGLGDNTVIAIHQSPEGALWFGTDGGVSRFEPATGQWQTFTTKEGLGDNTVIAIHQSPEGALWFGTDGGVSRFEPATGQWQTFTTKEGLGHNSGLGHSPESRGDTVVWHGRRG